MAGNDRITPEWITEQREKHCGVTNYKTELYIVSRFHLLEMKTTIKTALDVLEASIHREAEKDAKIEEQAKRIMFLENHILRTTHTYKKSRDKLLDERDRLTTERDAEKRRADAAVKDLKTVCTLAIDEGADCACCAVCKHSRGMPPLGSSDDCDILRYDEKTDEIIGECKWEWRDPCAENTPTGAESEREHAE